MNLREQQAITICKAFNFWGCSDDDDSFVLQLPECQAILAGKQEQAELCAWYTQDDKGLTNDVLNAGTEEVEP